MQPTDLLDDRAWDKRRYSDDVDLATRLRWAIDAGEIEVHYQPLIDLRSGATVRVEALARWPEVEPIGPATFVAAAERADTVPQLDLYVLGRVVAQLEAWGDAGLHPMVSVNFSQRTLARAGVVEVAIDLVLDSAVRPDCIQVEVTETAEADLDVVATAIDAFREAGIRVALDDFGTRYSFLPHLMVTAADELKIDRLFVRYLPDPRATMVTTSIIRLAHELGLEVVAEGIETVEQLQCIRALDCDTVQGFLFSPAVDANAVVAFFGATLDLDAVGSGGPPG